MLISIKGRITSIGKESFIVEQFHDWSDPGCAMSLRADAQVLKDAKRLLNKTAFIKASFSPFTKDIKVLKVEA